jgi:hypothetical protein
MSGHSFAGSPEHLKMFRLLNLLDQLRIVDSTIADVPQSKVEVDNYGQ